MNILDILNITTPERTESLIEKKIPTVKKNMTESLIERLGGFVLDVKAKPVPKAKMNKFMDSSKDGIKTGVLIKKDA